MFHYRTQGPIQLQIFVVSGQLNAIATALDAYRATYGSYRQRQLLLVETSSYAIYAISTSGTIVAGETWDLS